MSDIRPSDTKLLGCKLTSGKQAIDLSGQIEAVHIFEDMTKPTMYAEVELMDSINLVEGLPIIGEEVIEFEFQSHGAKSSVKYKFAVHRVERLVRDDQGKVQRFTLACVSEEHLANAHKNVRKSYEGVTVSTIVRDLIGTVGTTKQSYIDECKGTQTHVIGYMPPLQAIDMMRTRAVHTQYSSSAFVFFENQLGFNFKCVEKLINEGKKISADRIYTYSADVNISDVGGHQRYRNILEYQVVTRFDTVQKIQMGAFASKVRSYDFVTKKITETNYKFADHLQFEKMDGRSAAVNTGKLVSQYESAPAVEFFVPKDTSVNENFIDQMIASRSAYAALLNQNVVRCFIHGDTTLAVGMVVQLVLPASKGTTGPVESEKMYGGNYLIKALKHTFVFGVRPEHGITMDCVKIGHKA